MSKKNTGFVQLTTVPPTPLSPNFPTKPWNNQTKENFQSTKNSAMIPHMRKIPLVVILFLRLPYPTSRDTIEAVVSFRTLKWNLKRFHWYMNISFISAFSLSSWFCSFGATLKWRAAPFPMFFINGSTKQEIKTTQYRATLKQHIALMACPPVY